MKIGFLDSGLGGLTVLSRALKWLPDEEFLYYADTLNAPYGSKPAETVKGHVEAGVKLLVEHGAEVIVIACNTATSIAAADLRKAYDLPILGMEPAVKPAIEISRQRKKRVLVVATPLTCKEKKMQDLLAAIDTGQIVDLVPLPKLVQFAEAFDFSDETVLPYLKEAFKGLVPSDYGSIVLGCTHFPFFSRQIASLFSGAVLVDGAIGTVRHLSKTVQKSKKGNGSPTVTYYLSGTKVTDEALIQKYTELMAKVDASA